MAHIATITIHVLDDAGEIRQRAAAAALFGFVEGAKVLMVDRCSLPRF